MAKKKPTRTASRRWPPHLLGRLRGLRDELAERHLGAMLITYPADIRYLTGFGGEDSWALLTPRSVIILSDHRFAEQLATTSPYARSVLRRKPLAQELARLVKRHRIRRIAFQAEHVTVAQRKAIIKQVGAKTLVETAGRLIARRAIKDQTELRAIRKALAIHQRAYQQTLPDIRPGMTEQQVAALLEYNMRSHGADGTSFPTIVAAGPNGSIPHHTPGRARVRPNAPLLIDCGVTHGGYCSDLTRVVCIGRMPRRIAEIYRIVLDAQHAAIDAIAPGRPLKQIDAAARKVIKKAGYAKRFQHGTGHGIGLEVHEEPRLSAKAQGELQPGHVVTVEPGIYLPGVGGVRIEDDVLVTTRGHLVLSTLPTDLESAIIGR